MQDTVFVAPEKLKLGMYVVLNLSWLDHPFAFNSFLIQTQAQIDTIRGLGLERVRIDPLRSRLDPVPERENGNKPAVASIRATPSVDDPDTAIAGSAVADPGKQARIERHNALRANIVTMGKQTAKMAQTVRNATKQLLSSPGDASTAAESLISDVAESLLADSSTMVHLLNDKAAGDEVYFHSLNVAMLSLLLAKALGLSATELKIIGVAAIFHDIGKEDIPSWLLLKTDALTHAEQVMLRLHAEKGAEMATRGKLSPQVVAAILEHHENMNGTGYPRGLKGEQIAVAARVIGVVNHYDNLCNPADPGKAMTPYETLSTMFAKRKGWFDEAILSKLVHVLGVYPPGSLVRLSNGVTGMVISVNAGKPLQPTLMIYDAAVPKNEAIILDLSEFPELGIAKALRPGALAPSVFDYLSPRKRMTYYFGNDCSTA
jgi:putative nucleotidyltransferase with HDIG domain